MENKTLCCKDCKYYKQTIVNKISTLCACKKNDAYPKVLGLNDECSAEFRQCFRKKSEEK